MRLIEKYKRSENLWLGMLHVVVAGCLGVVVGVVTVQAGIESAVDIVFPWEDPAVRHVVAAEAKEIALANLDRYGALRILPDATVEHFGDNWLTSGRYITADGSLREFSTRHKSIATGGSIGWLLISIEIDGLQVDRDLPGLSTSIASDVDRYRSGAGSF